MAIYLKRAYEPAAPEDGHRVLVDRMWPRGVSKEEGRFDAWFKEIAPSPPLREWFHQDRSRWDAFRLRYLGELEQHHAVLAKLAEMSRRGPVTLVYSARDTRRNNAVVVAEFLQRAADASDPS